MRTLLPLLLPVLLAGPLPAGEVPFELTPATLNDWRRYLEPKPEEVAYLGIGWRPTLWEAVREARRREMPVLLWAMNGHPLGCT